MPNTNNHSEWTPPSIAVQPVDASALPQAQALVEHWNSIHRTSVEQHDSKVIGPPFELINKPSKQHWVLQIGLELPRLIRPDGVSWIIDYRTGKARHRAEETNRANQPLARALGIAKLNESERAQWHVVDGTAGAGADGWQLAATGASVTMVEQHPVLFTMLDSAINCALSHDSTQHIAQRVVVVNNTIEHELQSLHNATHGPANAVYLDPMYPVRRSKAAVKKPMQFIQALVGHGPNPLQMLQYCLTAMEKPTLNRVVVKRPSDSDPLMNQSEWSGQLVNIDAGAARFDVYLKP